MDVLDVSDVLDVYDIDEMFLQVVPSLPASKKNQVEALQRKLAESETGSVQKSSGSVAGVKDMDVKVNKEKNFH